MNYNHDDVCRNTRAVVQTTKDVIPLDFSSRGRPHVRLHSAFRLEAGKVTGSLVFVALMLSALELWTSKVWTFNGNV